MVFKAKCFFLISVYVLALQACYTLEGEDQTAEGIDIDGEFTGVSVNFEPNCSGLQSSTGRSVKDVTKIQSIGDSLLGFRSGVGSSIPEQLARILDVPVSHNAQAGTALNGGEIQSQYAADGASHVLISGGGNDLAAECSQDNLDSLISADGRAGYLIDIIEEISADGAEAILVGYFTPINREVPCDLFHDFFDRVRLVGRLRADTSYVCTLDTITPDRPELYADSIHPSSAGSLAIATKIAKIIE